VNFSITYDTIYRYAEPVLEQHNALRIRPQATNGQRVHSFELIVEPQARLYRHTDYWGTDVTEFSLSAPHAELAITARARVSTQPGEEPPVGIWDALGAEDYRLEGDEFSLWSPHVQRTEVIDELARGARSASAASATPLGTALALCELIRGRFEYRQGVTEVGSTVDQLIDAGSGVCQDFVNLALAVLSRLGLAGRYVSGYLFTTNGDSSRSEELNTHAWAEVLIPTASNPVWVGIDPTNGGIAAERHVKIGHGRSYSDVPPIKGIYRGTTRSEHEVAVTMVDLEAGRE
jgi:transglutaminase-like putative cysteine protease